MGTGDAKNTTRFGDIVAVCDVDKDRLEATRAIHKGAKSYEDYRKVCDQPGSMLSLTPRPTIGIRTLICELYAVAKTFVAKSH